MEGTALSESCVSLETADQKVPRIDTDFFRHVDQWK